MRKNIIFLLSICLTLMIFEACGKEVGKEEFLKDFAEKYVEEYTVVDRNDDGISKISIVAPDIVEIARIIFEDNQEEKLDLGRLQEAINEYSDYKKEYIIEVDEVADLVIERKFYDEIVRKLVDAAFESLEFREEWSIIE